VDIDKENLPEMLDHYFDKKINDVLSWVKFNENVFNGNRRLECEDFNFMGKPNILSCIKSLKKL
jgi:hypothetical protein